MTLTTLDDSVARLMLLDGFDLSLEQAVPPRLGQAAIDLLEKFTDLGEDFGWARLNVHRWQFLSYDRDRRPHPFVWHPAGCPALEEHEIEERLAAL